METTGTAKTSKSQAVPHPEGMRRKNSEMGEGSVGRVATSRGRPSVEASLRQPERN